MLDHIAFGPLTENPTGKLAIPFLVARLKNDQLNERASFRIILPRRGLFASLQADDGIANTLLFAGLHR
jgi:hypothetical protein